jgi:hypothetical protein
VERRRWRQQTSTCGTHLGGGSRKASQTKKAFDSSAELGFERSPAQHHVSR